MEEKKNLKDIIDYISEKNCTYKSDPFYNILNNFSQIDDFFKLNSTYITKFLFFSRKKNHNILYDEEKNINIQNEVEIMATFPYNFYLNLLIADNFDIINYEYSLDFIKNIDIKKKYINNKYTKILFCKIIIVLIQNYEQLDDKEKEKISLKQIKSENQIIIKENLTIFKKINLNLNEKEIISKKLDELLADIIKSLIINGNFENEAIIKNLDLEDIDITEVMFNSLHNLLDKNKLYINKYIIQKKEDLFDKKNITFYYVLLKYILKNSIYIYQIPLLLELRKFILVLIKSNEILYNGLNEEENNKLEYIVKTLSDSEYFFNKSKNAYLNQFSEVLNYFKDFQFISKKEDINILENIIKNKKIKNKRKDIEKYLSVYEIAKITNIRAPIIKYLINSKKFLKSQEMKI